MPCDGQKAGAYYTQADDFWCGSFPGFSLLKKMPAAAGIF